EAFAHQAMPFEKLVEALAPERDASSTPLFQVALAFQERVQPEALAAPDADAGLAAELQAVEIGTAKFDLTLEAFESRERLVLTWEYCRDLFDRTTVRRLAAAYLLVLAEAARVGPERRLEEIGLAPPAGRPQALLEGGGDRGAVPEPATVHGSFAATARHRPDAVALLAGDGNAANAADIALSYGELARRSRH